MARILVIDDHPDTRELIRTVLTHAGHDVSVAADGEEGLRRYASERPELVVTDIVMPGMDGLGLIASLRRTAGTAPKIVAISAGWGADADDALRRAARAGADRVLRKPLELETLVAIVKDLLAV